MFSHIHIQNDAQTWHVWCFVVYEWFLHVCRRQRELKPGQSPYRALLDTLELSKSRLTLQLIDDNNKVTKDTKIDRSIAVSYQQMWFISKLTVWVKVTVKSFLKRFLDLKSQCFLMIIQFNCNINYEWVIHIIFNLIKKKQFVCSCALVIFFL